MDANFSADSSSNKDPFFRPKRAATPAARHVSLTIKIRFLHNDPGISLQNAPEPVPVAAASCTQHHEQCRNPLTSIVNGIWRAVGSRWQIVVRRFRIRLLGLFRTAVLAKTGELALQRIQTTGLVSTDRPFVIATVSGARNDGTDAVLITPVSTALANHQEVKQPGTLLAETMDCRAGLQPSRNDSGGRMSRHGNLSPSVIANCAAVRRSRVSTGLLHTTGARNDGMHVSSAQRGAVLITGLIFLVILMLIGTTAMQGTLLEEKMAGNLRDETLAFQAAEAALRSGERFLEQVTLPEFNGSDGLYHHACSSTLDPGTEDEGEDAPHSCPPTPDPVTQMNWNADDSKETDVGMDGVASQPRYFIEQLPSVPLMGDGGSAQQSGASLNASMFRIVAQGTGGTAAATVLLQSTYRR